MQRRPLKDLDIVREIITKKRKITADSSIASSSSASPHATSLPDVLEEKQFIYTIDGQPYQMESRPWKKGRPLQRDRAGIYRLLPVDWKEGETFSYLVKVPLPNFPGEAFDEGRRTPQPFKESNRVIETVTEALTGKHVYHDDHLFMEYEGDSFGDFLKHQLVPTSESISHALFLLTHIALVLHKIHQSGSVHNDVHADNFLCSSVTDPQKTFSPIVPIDFRNTLTVGESFQKKSNEILALRARRDAYVNQVQGKGSLPLTHEERESLDRWSHLGDECFFSGEESLGYAATGNDIVGFGVIVHRLCLALERCVPGNFSEQFPQLWQNLVNVVRACNKNIDKRPTAWQLYQHFNATITHPETREVLSVLPVSLNVFFKTRLHNTPEGVDQCLFVLESLLFEWYAQRQKFHFSSKDIYYDSKTDQIFFGERRGQQKEVSVEEMMIDFVSIVKLAYEQLARKIAFHEYPQVEQALKKIVELRGVGSQAGEVSALLSDTRKLFEKDQLASDDQVLMQQPVLDIISTIFPMAIQSVSRENGSSQGISAASLTFHKSVPVCLPAEIKAKAMPKIHSAPLLCEMEVSSSFAVLPLHRAASAESAKSAWYREGLFSQPKSAPLPCSLEASTASVLPSWVFRPFSC